MICKYQKQFIEKPQQASRKFYMKYLYTTSNFVLGNYVNNSFRI
ncbi:protein of unknown function [Candidatus Nitrosocosmicus franklandus]|uniref:Uncharacterized protein n=1 Tax=Candidatus Nitrosocosmicus franklandianus TaxID=1798806 RepID=A0A484I9M7_9ARCH|nr:protein of unknown function [Candidatus Nitrosocosmicus franklandus]